MPFEGRKFAPGFTWWPVRIAHLCHMKLKTTPIIAIPITIIAIYKKRE